MKRLWFVFVIVVVALMILSACGSSDKKPEVELPEDSQSSYYDSAVKKCQDNIRHLLEIEPLDNDLLWENYKALLSYRMSEVMFKQMAHGHFTGEYDEYDHLIDVCIELETEMLQYFSESSVEELYTRFSILAWEKYDDEVFDYEPYFEGEKSKPDVDKMWKTYFEKTFKPQEGITENAAVPETWVQWTGEIGWDPYFEITLSYPDAWDEYGLVVLSEEREIDSDHVGYRLEFYLEAFEAEVFSITLVVRTAPDDRTLQIDDTYVDSMAFGTKRTTLFQENESGCEYRLDVSYSDILIYYDSKEWRNADWLFEVDAYRGKVISTIQEYFMASFAVG